MNILLSIGLLILSFFVAVIIYGIYLGYKDFQENKVDYMVDYLIENAEPVPDWMLRDGE